MGRRFRSRIVSQVRDTFEVARRPRLSLDALLRPVRLPPLVSFPRAIKLEPLQSDLRRFSFDDPVILDRASRPVRVSELNNPVDNSGPRYEFVSGKLYFVNPFGSGQERAVDVSHHLAPDPCVRRKVRREVIFAKVGGGGGKRRPRWNGSSFVRC